MNKHYIFTTFCLVSFSFSCFSMENVEKSEKIKKAKKIKKRILVLKSFLHAAQKYPRGEKRVSALDTFTNNAFQVWKDCAISEKENMGKVSGAAVSSLIDFDAIKSDKKNLKNPIKKLIKVRVSLEKEKVKPAKEKPYIFKPEIFEKVIKQFSVESQKRLLWLGVELAKTDDGKYFKEIIGEVINNKGFFGWIAHKIVTRFDWVRGKIYNLLVTQSDWIEGEIDRIVTKPIDFSKKK